MDWFKREVDCELCGKSTNKKEMNSIHGKKYCDECGSSSFAGGIIVNYLFYSLSLAPLDSSPRGGAH